MVEWIEESLHAVRDSDGYWNVLWSISHSVPLVDFLSMTAKSWHHGALETSIRAFQDESPFTALLWLRLNLLAGMGHIRWHLLLLVVPKPCMSFWSCTIWPLTAHKNGTSSWTVACLGAWVRAGFWRALALHMYNKCHIAPSHRRFAHPSWIAGMKLMLDLLLGARKHRYLRTLDPRPAQVYVRGFSAGSYTASPVEHASCPSRRHSGRHCLFSGMAT